jgi:hypothetical protein
MSLFSFRLPKLPHLPEYKTPQNQADEPANIKKYREDLHRALQEGLIQIDGMLGPGSATGPISITATTPIVVTPSPLIKFGVISHATSGVSAATYGDGTHVPQIAVNATGHITGVTSVAITGGGSSSPLTTKGDIWAYDTTDDRFPVGAAANGTVLTIDSTQAFGFKWAALPAVGVLQAQEFTTPGANTFNVPAGVTMVWVRMIGGGGGGSTTVLAATGGGGGGCGEEVENLSVPCTSSGTISITVGAKGNGGAAGQASAQAGTDGGDTSVTSNSITYFARGGKGATTGGVGGAGGGPRGGTGGGTGAPGVVGVMGTQESPVYFGGAGGSGGGSTTAANGGLGTANAGYPTGATAGTAASTQAGGAAGAASPFGIGGAGGNGGAIGSSAASTSYGAGGGGGGGKATTTIGGGNGTAGYVVVQWIA